MEEFSVEQWVATQGGFYMLDILDIGPIYFVKSKTDSDIHWGISDKMDPSLRKLYKKEWEEMGERIGEEKRVWIPRLYNIMEYLHEKDIVRKEIVWDKPEYQGIEYGKDSFYEGLEVAKMCSHHGEGVCPYSSSVIKKRFWETMSRIDNS
jgi:hypothetical protein